MTTVPFGGFLPWSVVIVPFSGVVTVTFGFEPPMTMPLELDAVVFTVSAALSAVPARVFHVSAMRTQTWYVWFGVRLETVTVVPLAFVQV